jgi:paraquat-inducible protein A
MTIGCPECGALENIPPLEKRMWARCRVCRFPLERTAGRSIGAAFAFSLATLIFLIPGYLEPLLSVHMAGFEASSVLGSGFLFMWGNGWVIITILLGSFGIIFPLIRFSGLSFVLYRAYRRSCPKWLGRLYRWMMWLDLWSMPDVFLIGFFIGYTRVHQHLNAYVGPGGYCFIIGALLTMVTRASLDRRTVWRAILPDRDCPEGVAAISCTCCDYAASPATEGTPCPRCGLTLRARKTDAVTRALALSVAALVLYIPANLFPMTDSYRLGKLVPHKIIDGVIELFQIGLWPFGILIFCTSIAIPLMKILGMLWFVISVKRRSRRFLKFKTHLYRIIDELGRWSNVDVFTLVVFVPLIRFGALASAWVRPGALAFTLVVFLTMVASRSFDSRLMWDAAEGLPA